MSTSSRRKTAVLAVLTALVASGCGGGEAGVRAAMTFPPESAEPGAPSSSAIPEPRAVGANELGQVPFLMYHRLVNAPESVYDRTPAQFRAELERLVAEGYVPVTATEAATGKIDIPAGKHPVVLTFDDGDATQFALDAAGEPVPGTAVGILRSVGAQYPGFRPVASLYVNANPFGGAAGALRWLHENGFEIGNHTYGHVNLGQLDAGAARTEIAKGQRAVEEALPGYRVSSLALPFGVSPASPEMAARGTADGVAYDYRCVLLVGAGPAPSPYSADFDPLNVPRIRSQDATGEDARYGSTAWLDALAADPGHRYTSDGRPDRVSYPLSGGVVPAEAFKGQAFGY